MFRNEPGVTRIKICCISSTGEVDLAARCGVDALGFVSAMPSGPGVVPEETIASLVPRVPAGIRTFLLTCEIATEAIVAQAERAGVDTLQLVDAVDAATLAGLRRRLPAVALVQVIHVTGEEAVAQALRIAPLVDALLLDSGNPALETKELGGTGRVHDWSKSLRIVQGSPVPVFLAGGLNPGNVTEAIRQVRPAGVDVCTGVRTAGRLDEEKLLAFCHAVRQPVSGIQQDGGPDAA